MQVELSGIYTNRSSGLPYYWDIVYEWEDVLADTLQIPLIQIGPAYQDIYKPGPLRKILNRLNYYQLKDKYWFDVEKYILAFHIGPPGVYSFHSRKNVIPVIIDFWKDESLKRFRKIFALQPIVFITSKEVFDFLKQERLDLNIAHLPLSLPDYLFPSHDEIHKDIDVIQLGRQNSHLTQYMERMLKEFPHLNYVYAHQKNGKLTMMSTRQGNLGEHVSRASFLQLLRRSKVSLLSAPGLDEDRIRTGGFSPVTPRFLESAASKCHLIGMYPDNADFAFFNMHSICSRPNDYTDFREMLLAKIAATAPDHSMYLKHHLTRVRAHQLLSTLKNVYAAG